MILGIDIGGTNVKFGVCDESYNIIKSIKTNLRSIKNEKKTI